MMSGHDMTLPGALARADIASLPVDDDIAQVLRSVADPEVGLNIVDLGLVYGALWASDGIRVLMTMTSASCPMADMLTDDVRNALRRAFPDAAVAVEVCLSPPWSPERITDAGRRELGWTKAAGAPAHPRFAWTAKLFGNLRRH